MSETQDYGKKKRFPHKWKRSILHFNISSPFQMGDNTVSSDIVDLRLTGDTGYPPYSFIEFR